MRVRFAPSPTGHLHVGNARTALFNWLLARGHGGTFVLRIEDTDTERSTLRVRAEHPRRPALARPRLGRRARRRRTVRRRTGSRSGSTLYATRPRAICSTRAARTTASARPSSSRPSAQAALAAGQPPKYSGRCRALDRPTARRRASRRASRPRFASPCPPGRDVTFHDLVRGDVTFSTDVIGDPVIVRSDGRPAYNFAVVVDDARMEITHVVRGEDHISNTPRQVLIYEALGADAAGVRAPVARARARPRAAVEAPRRDERRGVSRARLFCPRRWSTTWRCSAGRRARTRSSCRSPRWRGGSTSTTVSHSAAVFDTGKLAWMNRHYMKEAPIRRGSRARRCRTSCAPGYVTRATRRVARLRRVAAADGGRVGRSARGDSRARGVHVRLGRPSAPRRSSRAEPDGARAVAAFAEAIGGAGPLDREAFRAAAARAREQTGLKGRALFHPIRVALTAADPGPELDLAVPAIDRGAALPAGGGRRRRFVVVRATRARLSSIGSEHAERVSHVADLRHQRRVRSAEGAARVAADARARRRAARRRARRARARAADSDRDARPARARQADARRRASGRGRRAAAAAGVHASRSWSPSAAGPPLLVVLDGIEDPQNVGAILRSADAAGAHGVIRQARHAAPLDGATAKASAGAVNHVRIATVVNIARALEELKALGVWTIGLDGGAADALRRGGLHAADGAGLGRRGHRAAAAGPGDVRPAGVDPDGGGGVEPERLGLGRGRAVRGGPAAPASGRRPQ